MDENGFSEWRCSLERRISLARNPDEMSASLREEIHRLGFERFSCFISRVVPFMSTNAQAIGDFPSEWVGCCIKGGLVLYDPVVGLCAKNNGVAAWGRDDVCYCDIASEALARCGIDYGVSCVVFPSRCIRGVFSLARSGGVVSEWEFNFLKERLRPIALLVVDRLIEVGGLDCFCKCGILSFREIQVLRCVADGETSKQIARSLAISNDTVNFHLKNIFQKLEVCNKAQAAAYAAIYGLI